MDQENVEEEALFVDENGAPLRFYLHKSIKQPGARIALETKIQVFDFISAQIPQLNRPALRWRDQRHGCRI
jgi:hypothetical protein